MRLAGWDVRASGLVIAGMLATLVMAPAEGASAQDVFPFGSELRMDARPLRGSKRVPFLEIESNGAAAIDLWCNSAQGQFVIAANTVTIIVGPKTQRACSPEQTQADRELLDALQQATNWKREGDGIVLIGPQQLRFQPSTN